MYSLPKTYVRWLQDALRRQFDDQLVVDGIAGPRTRAAVRAFQASVGLKPDGVAGPATIGALRDGGAPPPPGKRPSTTTTKRIRERPSSITWAPSRHHGSRRSEPITGIVYHFTAGRPEFPRVVRYLQDNSRNVSAHFVIGKVGEVAQLVDLDRAAFHAGRGRLGRCRRPNQCTVGIEIVNWGELRPTDAGWRTKAAGGRPYVGPTPIRAEGTFWEPFTDAQYDALSQLTRHLLTAIPTVKHLVGHEHVALPRGRKNDPGPAFDWARLHADIGADLASKVTVP